MLVVEGAGLVASAGVTCAWANAPAGTSVAAQIEQAIERQVVLLACIIQLSVADAASQCNVRTVGARMVISRWATSEMMIPQALLFADADFTVVDVVREYTSFAGSFLIVGATAFYFLLLRPTFMPNMDAMRVASRSAARIGVVGAVLRLLMIGMTVMGAMLQKQLTFVAALTSKPSLIVGEIATVIALFAFASAAFAWRAEIRRWALAGIATLVIALQGVVTTKPARMVNPITSSPRQCGSAHCS